MIADFFSNVVARVHGGFMFSDGVLFMAGLWFVVTKVRGFVKKSQ